MTIPYEDIYSRFRGSVSDARELAMDGDDLKELYTERLHKAMSDPRVSALYASIKFDDAMQTLDLEMENPTDAARDSEFAREILAIGMAIQWMTPKVNEALYMAPMIGGKEEKTLMNNYGAMRSQLDEMKRSQERMIRDRGTLYNTRFM